MQLNAEDGGNRRFICVQLPEPTQEDSEAFKAGYKNICEIGKERIRRAGEKIKKEIESDNVQLKIGEEPKSVPDIGFKVFKLDSSNLKKWNPDFANLEVTLDDMINNYVPDRTEEDIVYEFIKSCYAKSITGLYYGKIIWYVFDRKMYRNIKKKVKI